MTLEQLEPRLLLTVSYGDGALISSVGTGNTAGDGTLTPPVVTAASTSSTTASVSWTTSPGATNYKVYANDGTHKITVGVFDASTTSTLITGLTAGANETITVYAYNSTIVTYGLTTLAMPQSPALTSPTVTATATSSTNATVSWTASAGATGYQVYAYDGTHTVLEGDYGMSVTSVQLTNLTAGKTETLWVFAYNASTCAYGTTTVSMPQSLAVPTVTATATSATTATVSWTASAGATNYQVYVADGGHSTLVGTFDGTTTSTQLTNLIAGTTASIYVKAYNSMSAAYGNANVTLPSQPLISPTVTATVTASTNATLSWTASAGATGYQVYAYDGTHTVLEGDYGMSVTSVQLTNLTAGKTETIWVFAYNSSTCAYGTTTVSMPQALAVPTVTATATSTTTATVSWTASVGATNYQVYVADGGHSTLVGTFDGSTTSAQLTNLIAGTTASIYVKAYNSMSAAYGNANVTLPLTQPLTAPTVTATVNSPTSVTVSWNATAGATGYQVYLYDGAHTVLEGDYGASLTSVQLTNMTAGKTETIWVFAYNKSTCAYGTTTLTMPLAPAVTSPIVTVTGVSTTSVNVSWTSSSNATGYQLYWFDGSTMHYAGTVDATKTSAQITGLPAGSTDTFFVYSFNSTSYAYGDFAFTLSQPQTSHSVTHA